MGGTAPDTTMSVEFEAPGRVLRRPFLFVVLRADRPLSPSARRSLHGATSVSLGRSAGAALSTSDEEDGSISLLMADPGISASHARLVRAGGQWSIEDSGSKNGTLLNGTRIRSAA